MRPRPYRLLCVWRACYYYIYTHAMKYIQRYCNNTSNNKCVYIVHIHSGLIIFNYIIIRVVLRRYTATNRHIIFSTHAPRFSGEFINQRQILATRMHVTINHIPLNTNKHTHTNVYVCLI